MTGKRVDSKKCPLCGGPLFSGEATIPYVLQGGTVVVVKNVPVEICGDCHEPFTTGRTTDQVMQMLRQRAAGWTPPLVSPSAAGRRPVRSTLCGRRRFPTDATRDAGDALLGSPPVENPASGTRNRLPPVGHLR